MRPWASLTRSCGNNIRIENTKNGTDAAMNKAVSPGESLRKYPGNMTRITPIDTLPRPRSGPHVNGQASTGPISRRAQNIVSRVIPIWAAHREAMKAAATTMPATHRTNRRAGSRVVLTHDVAQRDNLRVGRHDGVAAVIEKLKGHPLFGHITLTRSERSPIAALVTEMLEEITPDALP